jgi:hypothetical protein
MVDGVARSVRINTDGRCLTSGLIESGMVFGNLPFAEDARTEQVEALVDCDVLRASTSDIEALASVDPIVARNLARSNAQRLRGAEARLAALAFQPVPARLAGVVIELADHFGKVTPEGVRIDVRLTHGCLDGHLPGRRCCHSKNAKVRLQPVGKRGLQAFCKSKTEAAGELPIVADVFADLERSHRQRRQATGREKEQAVPRSCGECKRPEERFVGEEAVPRAADTGLPQFLPNDSVKRRVITDQFAERFVRHVNGGVVETLKGW